MRHGNGFSTCSDGPMDTTGRNRGGRGAESTSRGRILPVEGAENFIELGVLLFEHRAALEECFRHYGEELGGTRGAVSVDVGRSMLEHSLHQLVVFGAECP